MNVVLSLSLAQDVPWLFSGSVLLGFFAAFMVFDFYLVTCVLFVVFQKTFFVCEALVKDFVNLISLNGALPNKFMILL